MGLARADGGCDEVADGCGCHGLTEMPAAAGMSTTLASTMSAPTDSVHVVMDGARAASFSARDGDTISVDDGADAVVATVP